MPSTEDQTREEVGATRTFAHEPGEGEALWYLGVLATVKTAGEQTGGQYSLVEILAPEGYPGVLHVHHQEDEGFYILEGELTFYVGDQTIKAHPGSFLLGPKDVPHAFTVDSRPAKAVVRPLARRHGGPDQGDGRASTLTDRPTSAGGTAR